MKSLTFIKNNNNIDVLRKIIKLCLKSKHFRIHTFRDQDDMMQALKVVFFKISIIFDFGVIG